MCIKPLGFGGKQAITSMYLLRAGDGSQQMYNPWLGANGEWFFCLERLPERQRRPARRRNQLSKYAERSAVGLPGAGNWTAEIIRAGRLAETEKLLPVNPVHSMNGINSARTNLQTAIYIKTPLPPP